MIVLRAAWVVPVDQPPIREGWVAVDEGRIAAVGGGDPEGNPEGLPTTAPIRNLGRVALMPGLVNAHTHLELSYLRNRVPPASAFTSWIKQLFAARGRSVERADDPRVFDAASDAAREARETGTTAVGDISNSLASVNPIRASGLRGLVFHELVGFKETTADLVEATRGARLAAAERTGVRITVAPHAPYSVSPELFRAIRAEVDSSAEPMTAVHVGESREEMELLASGTGEWRRMLQWIGAWREDWTPPGTGPVEYLESLGMIDRRTLVVHGVQLTDESLARLSALGATLVTCPRSNQWVGVGVPPIERFYRSGVSVAVGTDSLASVEDLNLFSELKTMRWLAPEVPARRLIESGTLIGARAIGLGDQLGSLTAGKLADVVAVTLPGEVDDIEEHLVNGIDARDIGWAWTAESPGSRDRQPVHHVTAPSD
jgi:cytosine/adenosine deaminase-related metal-dependent hydrolase